MSPDAVAPDAAPDPGTSPARSGAGAGGAPDAGLPPEAYVVALASLDLMGPARLRSLLDACGGPAAAWRGVVDGDVPARAPALAASLGGSGPRVLAGWSRGARATSVPAVWAAHVESGIHVAVAGSPSFPLAFAGDPDPPAVVFAAGDLGVLGRPAVAIVGTRDCTRYGHDVARLLGEELAGAGVTVVSGLALGIDGAAHAGALEAAGAPPVAVVGSGLDVVYPRRNRDLWQRVAVAGVVLSEHPLGTAPVGWHFPARNRLIAALADVVVVVESQERGGSMHTVDEALARDVDVLAVPGPVTSPSSAGTNQLLADGAGVVRDATDVLVRLGLGAAAAPARSRSAAPADPGDAAVLEAFDWQPAVLDQLVLRTGRSLDDLAAALDRLEAGGWVERRGGWFERRVAPGTGGRSP